MEEDGVLECVIVISLAFFMVVGVLCFGFPSLVSDKFPIHPLSPFHGQGVYGALRGTQNHLYLSQISRPTLFHTLATSTINQVTHIIHIQDHCPQALVIWDVRRTWLKASHDNWPGLGIER